MNDQIRFYEAKLRYETDAWDLFESMQGREPVIVVDARSPEAYGREHIPSAINIPHRAMSKESMANLDFSQRYVTYCDGIGCNASTKAALKMAQLGFSVQELLGGLAWWKRDGYATEGLEGADGKAVDCGC